MTAERQIARFVEDRNAALLSLDRAIIAAFARRYGLALHPNEEIFWAGVHKARLAIPSLPDEARELSAQWLTAHGYATQIDLHRGEGRSHG